jgi:hypothetical protein
MHPKAVRTVCRRRGATLAASVCEAQHDCVRQGWTLFVLAPATRPGRDSTKEFWTGDEQSDIYATEGMRRSRHCKVRRSCSGRGGQRWTFRACRSTTNGDPQHQRICQADRLISWSRPSPTRTAGHFNNDCRLWSLLFFVASLQASWPPCSAAPVLSSTSLAFRPAQVTFVPVSQMPRCHLSLNASCDIDFSSFTSFLVFARAPAGGRSIRSGHQVSHERTHSCRRRNSSCAARLRDIAPRLQSNSGILFIFPQRYLGSWDLNT